ncbi:MAG: FG-GAP-like repeat-containing protein, partial [Phycisphaerae bacterium]
MNLTSLTYRHAFMALAGVAVVPFSVTCRRADAPATQTARRPTFVDVTESAGITHTHVAPILDHKLDNIMSWMCSVGAAAAAGDYNNDGWIDLYVTNSRKGTPNYLYRNNGDGTFTDVAAQAGVANLNDDSGTSMDAVWGDYDNDGWVDLYVLKWGTDVLLKNNGDGSFTDVTGRCFKKQDGSPGTPWANGNAVIFFDYNLDGRLDLFVGNYFRDVDLWHLKTTRIMHDSFEKARNGGPCFLYRQNPDGTFTDVAVSLGVDDPGWTLAVGSADINNDGWPDLYCADDFGPDQLFLNRKNGTFENVTATAIGFDSKKGMNVDFGDFNNDGWLDVYVTNITTAEYLQEGNMLWHNNGLGEGGQLTLTDVAIETGTYDGGWGWGAKFFDYDNDADLDLVALNGFISAGEGSYWYDLASWTVTEEHTDDARNWPDIGDRSFSGYERIRLWRNDGQYTFTETAVAAGLDSRRDGRGAVPFDYDNDGDLDLFVANQAGKPHLFRNDTRARNHFLIVDLKADAATGVNRDGVGTRVTILTDDGRQIRERDGGNGYCGQSDPRIHFGLGDRSAVRLLEVRWPDGGLQYMEDVAADRILVIHQDPARYAGRLAIEIDPPKPWRRADDGSTPTSPPPDPKEVDRILSEVEQELHKGLTGFSLASTYRARCVDFDRHDRAIDFFKQRVNRNPQDDRARIELGCAYIDKIPTCGGLAAIVSKGTLARKSLDQLDLVIDTHGGSWVAYYTRGMNHLYWPRALRHSDDAVADLERCLEIQAAGRASTGAAGSRQAGT